MLNIEVINNSVHGTSSALLLFMKSLMLNKSHFHVVFGISVETSSLKENEEAAAAAAEKKTEFNWRTTLSNNLNLVEKVYGAKSKTFSRRHKTHSIISTQRNSNHKYLKF